MADVGVTLSLPTGGSHEVDMPDDVVIKELMPELITALELPVTGPDGRPLIYRMDSKRLGRRLEEAETLASTGTIAGDRLVIATDITAG